MMNLFENLQIMKETNNINIKNNKRVVENVLSNTHKDVIIDMFNKQKLMFSNAPEILDSYTQDNEFVVVLDNSNPTYIAGLEEDLYKLEDKYNIGFEKKSNDNGFYGYTYTFYYYDEELNESKIIKDEKDVEQIVENTELKTMSNSDSYGWQGATNFTDGTKPLIAYGEFGTMIVSGPDSGDTEGATVAIYFGEEGEHWAFSSFISKEKAVKYAKMLLPLIDAEIDDNDLKHFGFEIVA